MVKLTRVACGLLCLGGGSCADNLKYQDAKPLSAERVLLDRYFKPRGCDDKRTRRTEMGDFVQVHFNGTVGTDGKGRRFDSTHDHPPPRGHPKGAAPPPMEFRITSTLDGGGMFVPGWEQAVLGACLGERRRATIPPALAFGEAGFPKGGIPGGASLHFDIAFVEMSDGPSESYRSPYPNMFAQMDADADGRLTRAEMAAWFAATQQSANGGDLPKQGSEGLLGLFDIDDADKDGFVSFEEFSGPKGLPPTEQREQQAAQKAKAEAAAANGGGGPGAGAQKLAGGVTMQAGVVDKDGNVLDLPLPVTVEEAAAQEKEFAAADKEKEREKEEFVRIGAEFDVAEGAAEEGGGRSKPHARKQQQRKAGAGGAASDADVPEVGRDEL
jgi:FK506-binding protein 14